VNIIETKQNWLQLTAIQAGGVICLPIFLIGHALANNYGALSAVAAILVGNLLLLVMGAIMAWSAACSRKSTAEMSVEIFGNLGRYLFASAMVASMMGWFAIQLNLMTLGIQEVFEGVPSTVCNLCLGMAVTIAGITGMKGLERIVNWSMPLLLLTILYALFQKGDATHSSMGAEILTFQGVSLVLAAAIAAVVDLPTFFRLSRSPKDGLIASCVLFGLVLPLLEGVGVYLFANQADENFVRVLASADSPLIWKGWVFAFIVFAGWTTNQANLYSAAVSMETICPRSEKNVQILTLGICGALLSCLNVLDHLVGILDMIGILLGSMGAVLIVHCLLRDRSEKRGNLLAWMAGIAAGSISQMGYAFTGIPVVDAFFCALLGMGVVVLLSMYQREDIENESTV
jgi:purine-cytosine permease-like protein